MTKAVPDDAAARGLALAEKIAPILHGEGPEAQGACLVTLVGYFLAGHHPALRSDQMAYLTASAWEMCKIREIEMGSPWREAKQ